MSSLMSDYLRKQERARVAAMRRRVLSDDDQHPLCECCGFAYPLILQLHHLTPLTETEVPTTTVVWLCPNCHAMVHELRKPDTASRTHQKMRENTLQYWLDHDCPPEMRRRLIELANSARALP